MSKVQVRAIAVLALFLLSTFSATFSTPIIEKNELENLSEIKLSKSTKNSVSTGNISSWRIGDQWTYDTVFDVTQLIAQNNVSGASVNALSGDTVNSVEDILFADINGTQTLLYQVEIDGEFTTGNGGATLEGISGRLNVDYEGFDYIRVSDLATVSSQFTVDVEFLPFNLGFLSQDVGSISVLNSYYPPSESFDFPIRFGDTWNTTLYTQTNVTGDSDYFDVSGLNQSSTGSYEFQVTDYGTPTDGTSPISYSGCADSFKISAWDNGTADGYKWYCEAVRSYAWNSLSSPSLGLQIDWKLKEYDPIDSVGTNIGSSPGIRDTVIDVNPQFDRIRPDADLAVWANYSSNQGQSPTTNTNLQLRWEADSILQSLTTKFNGSAWSTYNVGNEDDNTSTSEDVGSHGLIVWDPVTEIIGVSTVVLDPEVTAIDLVARSDSVVIERTRENITENVPPYAVYTLPGDELKFTMLTQNRGTETAPQTVVEVSSPDGTSSRSPVPSLTPMESLAFVANWTVPENQVVGDITLTFEVDPDGNITEDGNKTNNLAEVTIFVGRLPSTSVTVEDEVLTHVNASIDASMSFDPDGGNVTCDFHVDEDKDGVEDLIQPEDDCILEWAWGDDGEHLVWITIYDDEGDSSVANTSVTVLNRAPWLNLTGPSNVTAESTITINASDNGDLDSFSEPVSISWPDVICNEGLTQPLCTFSPSEEGEMTISAVATDEDNATTLSTFTFMVDNRPPVLENVELWSNGSLVDGDWEVFEDETIQLVATGYDTLLDVDSLFYHWTLDADVNPDEMITTYGASSTTDAMWTLSGEHRIQVELFDNDGASGGTENRTITVINVPPVVPTIENPLPVFEDQEVTLSGGATDTASDANNLTLCWDLYPEVNTDDTGGENDDCNIEGSMFVHSYTKKGNYTVTFHATDDDGDMSFTDVNIEVLNKNPIAILTGDVDLSQGLTLTEGDSYTFYGFLSEDTPSDSDELWIWWDNDCLDSNADGNSSGDIDVDDINATFQFSTPATCVITLHIEDTDGGQSTASVTVTVQEMPILDSLMGKITEPAGIVSILIIVLSLLLVFLLLRGRRSSEPELSSEYSSKEWNYEPAPGLMTQATGQSAYDPLESAMGQIPDGLPPTAEQSLQTSWQQPVATTPVVNISEMSSILDPQPTSTAQVQQPVPVETEVSAPPVPATGLPPGWSMEQWKFYGAKWLEQQQTEDSQAISTVENKYEIDDDLDL